jgi:hypothetical protein
VNLVKTRLSWKYDSDSYTWRGVKSVAKVALWGVGGVLLVVFALVVFVLVSWGGEKDRLVLRTTSPDGKLIAELHQDITSMHGGPDRLRLTIGRSTVAFGDTVFSEVWECSDDSAMHLAWNGSDRLTFQLGHCVPHIPDAPENHQVFTRSTRWHEVSIAYSDSPETVNR